MPICTQCGEDYQSTKAVRALLCIQCNTAVGMVRESVEIAEQLVTYLKLHQAVDHEQS